MDTMQTKQDERKGQYDCIRVIAMLMVICIHTSPKPLQENTFFIFAFNTVLFLCNTLFYMLSGMFNLRKEFHSKQDCLRFYRDKLGSIVIPYLTISIVLSVLVPLSHGESVSLKQIYVNIMQENTKEHLWFMYPLMGLLLTTPFLSKLLHAMKAEELRLLLVVSLIWIFVQVYLCEIFKIGFSYSSFFFAGWPVYYLLGYYCIFLEVTAANRKRILFMCITGFLVSAYGWFVFEGLHANQHALAPAFIAFSVSAYLLMEKYLRFRSVTMGAVVRFVAKNSFMVYLIHWHILFLIVPKITNLSGVTRRSVLYLEKVVITALLSLAVAAVLNRLVFDPVNRFIRKHVTV